MKPIVHVGHEKKVIMEVIGEDGQKVADYVEGGPKKKKRQYHILQERYVNAV